MVSSRSRSTVAPVVDFSPPTGLTNLLGSTLSSHENYELVTVSDVDVSGLDLSGITFTECQLDGLTLSEAQLRGARFVDTTITASFAPVMKAARTSWRRCRIDNPRWGSAELFDADFENVLIHGGKVDFLNLRGSRLTNVMFEGCTITELDLTEFRGDRVAFSNCRIDTLEMARARCANVDLRSSEFARINGIDGLRGATIDPLQLSLFSDAFAQHLGVRVE